jgi:metal-responsive CopG/Arc/MetJ family transcriptional regulator
MKVKTSVSLSKDLLGEIDRWTPSYGSRSELVETALRTFLKSLARAERDERDLTILDRAADRLNTEAADTLAYQAER